VEGKMEDIRNGEAAIGNDTDGEKNRQDSAKPELHLPN